MKKRDDDDEDEGEPSLTDAMIASLIHHGGKTIKAKVREATGRLDPHRVYAKGVIEDVPMAGTLEIRVFVPGVKSALIVVPYASPAQASAFDAQVRALIGHAVRLTIEIDR